MILGWIAAVLALLLSTACRADCPPAPPAIDAAQMAQWQSHAVNRGVLWRVTRDGHSSWLFGSLHVGRAPWIAPGPALMQALQHSDTLAVELDMTDPSIVSRVLAAAQFKGHLPPKLQRRLEAQARAACLPESALQGQHPVLALSTLTLMDAQRDGLYAQFGQDILLTAMAKQMQHDVIALETPESQMQVLLPQDQAELEQEVAEGLDQLEDGAATPLLHRLASDWARGDLADLEHYEQWCDCVHNAAERADMHRLNDERNGPMAKRIAALHAQGKRLLVVVGALHMTGDNALPRLLAAQGFTVERIAQKSSR